MHAQEENKYRPDGPVCGLGIVLVHTPHKKTSAVLSIHLTRMHAQEENKYGPDGPVCGLGIVLVPTPFGSLCVASITEGGPAARSGRIVRGDFVETIDGVSVKVCVCVYVCMYVHMCVNMHCVLHTADVSFVAILLRPLMELA
jgi:hypothetical protein